ncbi:HSF-type DNA-binding-domain-containing protein [Absidia repens]|uniref:HSF-type DNA-binding-domain-containing protein n=1 Tax=Absidia repens TaxID=90262 RepID=A0A1X2IRC2_9FUNG|nr:HSF-type DNA-binding-domain-containing protein [Absidia repens]
MADHYISPVKNDHQGQSASNVETFTFRVEPSSVPVFITKLSLILDDSALRDMISWSNDGKRFCVFDISGFSKVVLPQYFKHSNWPSFVRQLNMYGFHKVNDSYSARHGQLICEFHHPLFYRNGRLELRKIRRNSRKSASTTVDPPQTQLPSIQRQKQHHRNHNRRCQIQLPPPDRPETSFGSTSPPLSSMPISSLISPNDIEHIDDNTAPPLNSIRDNETFDMDTIDDNLNDSNDRTIIGNSKSIVESDNQNYTHTSFGNGDFININMNKGKRATDIMYDDDIPERNKNDGHSSTSQLAKQYTEIRRQLNTLESSTASLNSEMSFLKRCVAKQQESVVELLKYLSTIIEDSQSPV